jgi:signal transduction histidine kinase
MSVRGHRRRVILFLVAIIVPSVVLVVLGLRMIAQESELAGKRLAEERQRTAAEFRQELLARLERVRLQEASLIAARSDTARPARYQNPEVVLVARSDGGRLILPWEDAPHSEETRPSLDAGAYGREVDEGERLELGGSQIERAAASYRRAARLARGANQTAYAHLLLARALARAGRRKEAVGLYEQLLSLPLQAADEQGLPFSFYAAERLLEAGGAHEAVLGRLRDVWDAVALMPPPALYFLRDLVGKLVGAAPDVPAREAAERLQEKALRGVQELEQALALQNDFPKLRPLHLTGKRPANADPPWVPYGEEMWLVSAAPATEQARPVVVAVRAGQVLTSLEAGRRHPGIASFKLVPADSESDGEPLGQNFPGLKLVSTPRDGGASAEAWSPQSWFYLVTLLLVVGVNLFAAHLLWRDVRRELRLAEMRSQFVSSVSHELKTPLTSIRMFAETLLLGRAADPRAQAEYLDTIVNESERLTRLLDNVLDFSKIEQGRKTYRFARTPLAEVVAASARALEYPLAQQGFELRVSAEESVPPVRGDADALQQAVMNLLTNAIKYAGESREIDLRLYRENGHAVIAVEDRGLGIAPEEQGRIFEKFYRVATPETESVPGAGLGLTLVAHVAQAHGGSVEVKSAPGAGSLFAIHLPLEVET